MYSVELYVKVRRAVMVDKCSEREVARLFGIHRKTVKKMCQFAVPPGYQRKSEPVSPKLLPFIGIIDVILEADKQVHVKQRHTARRILERLRDEHGFTGGYTIVRNYVYKVATRHQEMFMPLAHRPGQAQVDFGEADGYIGGKKVRFHYFCMDLPHSDACFVKAYPTEDTESFLDGHIAAFAFLGGVPPAAVLFSVRLMEITEEFTTIESIFVRHRNALLVRGQFTSIYTDYYLHLMQHSIRPPAELDQMLKDMTALLTLHLVSRPWAETIAWTANLRAPRINLFVTGSSLEESITGRVFTE